MTTNVDTELSYFAIALQTSVEAVNALRDPKDARARMAANIGRIATEVRSAKLFVGADTRLVVLPEYFLTSYPTSESLAEWRAKAAIDIDGPEYEALGRIASDNAVHLAGNAYETDPHFAELYFQTSFVVAPSGDVVLRYRRLNSMFAPTPHDVWDKYLDVYGRDGVFPVAKTAIGKLAAIASEEILYPEIARSLALRGAEVFVHSSSEIGSPLDTPKSIAKRARAIENMAYVVSANTARIIGQGLPESAADGNSMIIDDRGLVLAESNPGPTMTAFAEVDVGALRRRRRRPGMSNYLSRQRLELFAETYAGTVQPANGLADEKAPDRSYFRDVQRRVIDKLSDDGVI